MNTLGHTFQPGEGQRRISTQGPAGFSAPFPSALREAPRKPARPHSPAPRPSPVRGRGGRAGLGWAGAALLPPGASPALRPAAPGTRPREPPPAGRTKTRRGPRLSPHPPHAPPAFRRVVSGTGQVRARPTDRAGATSLFGTAGVGVSGPAGVPGPGVPPCPA